MIGKNLYTTNCFHRIRKYIKKHKSREKKVNPDGKVELEENRLTNWAARKKLEIIYIKNPTTTRKKRLKVFSISAAPLHFQRRTIVISAVISLHSVHSSITLTLKYQCLRSPFQSNLLMNQKNSTTDYNHLSLKIISRYLEITFFSSSVILQSFILHPKKHIRRFSHFLLTHFLYSDKCELLRRIFNKAFISKLLRIWRISSINIFKEDKEVLNRC